MTGDIEVFAATGERNVLAGRMYPHLRRGSESASFIYDDKYLANPGAYQLDPALPLVTGALETLAQVTRAVARWREVAVSRGLQQHDLDMMGPAFEHAEARRAWDLIKGRSARA